MSTLRGPILMVAAMAGFAVEDALIKLLARDLPPGQIALFLGIVGGLVFEVLSRRQGRSLFVRQSLRGPVLLRNLAEAGAVMTMILGVALVPLSTVSAILQAMPLTVTLGAAVFLGEPVGWRRWSAILVGLVGVLLIVQPGADGFDQLALLPVAAVLLLSVRDVATRRIGRDVASVQVAGWGFLAAVPGGLILLALRGEGLILPDAMQAGLLAATGVVGILGYGALVAATRSGSIGSTTPFRYSRLVFALIIGMVFFGERPDALMLAGSALVVAAGLYALMRELRRRG